MRKALLIFAITGTLHAGAQNIYPEFDNVRPENSTAPHVCSGYAPSGWTVELNGIGGGLKQNITAVDPTSYYSNALNTGFSDLKFSRGRTYGFDVQAGYFFDEAQHFGAGTGFMYMAQKGDLSMSDFHVEYQSTDNSGNTFRQIISANHPITENLVTTNINIPVVFKYKTEFSDYLGLTVDAGVVFNLVERNSYWSNASFDYEAIYKYTGVEGNIVPVYDNSPVPAASDLIITRQQYLNTHTPGAIREYFNSLAAKGYNVGLGVTPNNNAGSVLYNSGSLGILLRPALSIYLSEQVELNVGAYYLYQNFTHPAPQSSRITDKLGDYNSLLTTVTSDINSSYGASVGIRYSFPQQVEAVVPVVAEEEKDNSGKVVAKEEEENEEQEEPQKPMPSPENASTEVIREPRHIDISTPILFEHNKMDIQPQFYPVLNEAIKALRRHSRAHLIINGYTDNTGKATTNKALSQKRANVVKGYLERKGISAKKLTAIGHGSASPVASNRTPEGRAKNRRVVMKLRESAKPAKTKTNTRTKVRKPVTQHTKKHIVR